MRDILITLFILGTIPYIFKRPYIGLLVYSWISYMNPHRLTWGFAHDLPFAALIVAVTLLSIVINKNELKKLPMDYSIIYIWLAWALWMNVAGVFAISIDPEYTKSEWIRAIKIQFVAFLSIMLLQSQKKVILLIWVIVISIGYYSVKGGIFTLLTAGGHIVFGPPDTFITGNNELAIATIMMIPLIWYLYQYNSNKYIKWALLFGLIFSVLTVIASYSRGALLAAAVVGLFFIIRSNRRLLILPLVLIMAVGIYSFMPDKYWDRMNTIQTYDEDASALGRINAWYFAFNIAKARPLVAGGFGAFDSQLFLVYAPEPDDFHDAHSIYFEVLGEQGFVGLALFLALGAMSLRMANKTRKKIKNIDEYKWAYDLLSMVYISILAYSVGGAFLGLAYFDLYYHLIGIVVLVKIIVEREQRKSEREGCSAGTNHTDKRTLKP